MERSNVAICVAVYDGIMPEDSAENFAQGQDRDLSHEYDDAISYFQKSIKDLRYKT
jgi:hypothetical protein